MSINNMVIIKLKRVGKKKQPFYHIIAIEKSFYINGKYIDKIGYYDPIKNNKTIELEKVNNFLLNGAVLSKRVKSLLKKYKHDISFNKQQTQSA